MLEIDALKNKETGALLRKFSQFYRLSQQLNN